MEGGRTLAVSLLNSSSVAGHLHADKGQRDRQWPPGCARLSPDLVESGGASDFLLLIEGNFPLVRVAF